MLDAEGRAVYVTAPRGRRGAGGHQLDDVKARVLHARQVSEYCFAGGGMGWGCACAGVRGRVCGNCERRGWGLHV